MKAIILAGGLGTRLAGLYPDRPKGLVPILGRPFLEWQIEWLAKAGVTHVHIAAGHKADQLADWAAHHKSQAVVSVSAEPEPLGTGGGLRFVRAHAGHNGFLILNGDSLTPGLDFQGLEKAHRESGAIITLTVTPIEDAGRYGTVEPDSEGWIRGFHEKVERRNGLISAGVYLADASIFDFMPDRKAFSIESDVFPNLAKDHRIFSHPCPPPLLDMGTPEGLKSMEAFLSGPAG